MTTRLGFGITVVRKKTCVTPELLILVAIQVFLHGSGFIATKPRRHKVLQRASPFFSYFLRAFVSLCPYYFNMEGQIRFDKRFPDNSDLDF